MARETFRHNVSASCSGNTDHCHNFRLEFDFFFIIKIIVSQHGYLFVTGLLVVPFNCNFDLFTKLAEEPCLPPKCVGVAGKVSLRHEFKHARHQSTDGHGNNGWRQRYSTCSAWSKSTVAASATWLNSNCSPSGPLQYAKCHPLKLPVVTT